MTKRNWEKARARERGREGKALQKWSEVTARFAGSCTACVVPFGVGERIRWKADEGARCLGDCRL
jgi:hypothetical protein